MRSIPLSVLGLVASVAVAGTPYSVARDGRGPTHHHFTGERGGRGAGHVQPQLPNSQSDQDHVEGSSHSGYFTLVSDWSGRDGLPDFSGGDRPNRDRYDGSSSDGASGYGGGGQGGGSGDPGRSGGPGDGAPGAGDGFSFNFPHAGFGGVGGYSGPSQNSKPDQGSNDGSSGDQGGDHGGHNVGDGGPPTNYGGNNGPPQPIGKNLATIGPVAGVPEPSTWMMMLVGVGALGAVLRRNRGRAPVRQAGVVGA